MGLNNTNRTGKVGGGGGRERQTDRQTGRQTDRQTGRQTDRQTDRQTSRQTDRQTKSQKRSQRQRQTDRQAGSDKDKDKDRETETEAACKMEHIRTSRLLKRRCTVMEIKYPSSPSSITQPFFLHLVVCLFVCFCFLLLETGREGMNDGKEKRGEKLS